LEAKVENEFWLNLSSKNLPKAKEFFSKIGFTMNDRHQAPHMVSMFIGNKKAVEAPGYKDSWMYGCGFTDLDGHRWNVLYMDMSKMPKG
jgi:hypothetical protein